MKNVILILRGFVMGIANVIPGVSGGTLALTMGIYEKLIEAINHFFSKLKENIMFILPIAFGMLLSIATMSNVVSIAFDKFRLATTLLFMGLVIGGIPFIVKKIKGKNAFSKPVNYIPLILTFALVIVLAFSKQIFGNGLGNVTLDMNILNLIKIFFIGVLAASTMIIPGVSGSLVLMLLGYYEPITSAIKDLTHFENLGVNFVNIFVFGIGVILGIVIVAKVIELLFKKQETKTYFGVLGFVLASVIAIPVSVINQFGNFSFGVISIVLSVILFAVGFIGGYKLGEK